MLNGKIDYSSEYLKELGITEIETDNAFDLLFRVNGNIIHTNSVCILSKKLDTNRLFALNVNWGEDVDMWYRIMSKGKTVFSAETTTIRYREDSTLSKNVRYVYNPIYLASMQEIINDDSISTEVRESCRTLRDNHKLQAIYHYCLDKKKGTALKNLLTIRINSKKIMFRYLKAIICILSPRIVLQKVYQRQEHKYYESKTER